MIDVPHPRAHVRDALLGRARTDTLIMGILNLTPDSFSDGGRHPDTATALASAKAMIADGADILDIGGESTRPGAPAISAEDELARILAPMRMLGAMDGPPLSIDTYKASVARAAADAGAVIINDIYGGMREEPTLEAAAETGCAFVVTYHRLVADPAISIIDDMRAFFDDAIRRAAAAGLPREHLILDPGLGFAKTYEQNFMLMARLDALQDYRLPILIGASRKSFIGRRLDRPVGDRLTGTIACNLLCARNGASILRDHDVAACRDALSIDRMFRDMT